MPALVIVEAGSSAELCSLCTRPLEAGLLRLQCQQQPVCRECGRQIAPTLAALLDLAQAAERIGRIHGHTPRRVSMEALLELAHVSEQYSSLVSSKRSAA